MVKDHSYYSAIIIQLTLTFTDYVSTVAKLSKQNQNDIF